MLKALKARSKAAEAALSTATTPQQKQASARKQNVALAGVDITKIQTQVNRLTSLFSSLEDTRYAYVALQLCDPSERRCWYEVKVFLQRTTAPCSSVSVRKPAKTSSIIG